ncbi:MAG: hypothetical protein K1060chlam4_01186, partial [Candidatus Anoxychlamydiales bacterium]|nr:hypothetical protein [Candidatus Anoxychlamydiales bacterium]
MNPQYIINPTYVNPTSYSRYSSNNNQK